MNLLAAERIKLFSTRSPWWCALVAVVVTAAFGAFMTGGAVSAGVAPTVASTQAGSNFGLLVVMVLAALSVTTEYRFGTLRTTFQAAPGRIAPLAAKAATVAGVALVIGEVAAFVAWCAGSLLAPDADLALNSAADWGNVAGLGPVCAFAALIAVAVGLLVRHSAGAVALLIIYAQAAEPLVAAIPSVGDDVHRWLPFNAASKFLTGNGDSAGGRDGGYGPVLSDSPLGQGWALAYFAAIALALLAIAIRTAKTRDA
ncbi:hypothetical protein [Amycolatopsis anabasis]|uniref:hypothetical protein n=1 Tax=Amycolatopsis anabasis TaxID=1840409 RepID=UPI00131D0CE3|nr:hypothetical protein [Amycolatopsis anabasis]